MTQRTRSNRFIRRAGTALVAILAVVGLVAAYQFFFGAPGVGHFRSDSGRAGGARRVALTKRLKAAVG